MAGKEKIIIFGATEAAVMSHYYFTYDSPFEVTAFTVDRQYIKEKKLIDLPVIPFEEVESIYPPRDYKMFIAVYFGRLNKTRAEKYYQAKQKGYELASYISSKAVTWPDLILGEHCLIGEGSVINPYVQMGNNVVVAGGFVGHHSCLEDHCFLAANSVVLGCSTIGAYCFIGANSTIRHGIRIGKECIVGAGVTLSKNIQDKSVFIEKSPHCLPKKSDQLSTWLTWSVR